MKKWVLGIIGLGVVATLVGCEERTLNYDGKELPESDVEEIIADKLEVDNPNLDLEVDIYFKSISLPLE